MQLRAAKSRQGRLRLLPLTVPASDLSLCKLSGPKWWRQQWQSKRSAAPSPSCLGMLAAEPPSSPSSSDSQSMVQRATPGARPWPSLARVCSCRQAHFVGHTGVTAYARRHPWRRPCPGRCESPAALQQHSVAALHQLAAGM